MNGKFGSYSIDSQFASLVLPRWGNERCIRMTRGSAPLHPWLACLAPLGRNSVDVESAPGQRGGASGQCVPRQSLGTRGARRRGFSLLEIMLVMALLVVVAAITYPSVTGPLDNNRLRYSADQIRACWARARNKAMESGRTYMFRCQPTTDRYMIEPWINNDDLLESDLVTQGGMMVGASAQEATGALLGPKIEKLPESVTFMASEVANDVRSQLLVATANATTETDQVWSTPIFFYPDGTSSTARLVLMNTRDRYVLMTLRGLTGVVNSRGLLTADELPK
jgi:prepilin-type N-terminal cleavage/methylation domain-containing protein